MVSDGWSSFCGVWTSLGIAPRVLSELRRRSPPSPFPLGQQASHRPLHSGLAGQSPSRHFPIRPRVAGSGATTQGQSDAPPQAAPLPLPLSPALVPPLALLLALALSLALGSARASHRRTGQSTSGLPHFQFVVLATVQGQAEGAGDPPANPNGDRDGSPHCNSDGDPEGGRGAEPNGDRDADTDTPGGADAGSLPSPCACPGPRSAGRQARSGGHMGIRDPPPSLHSHRSRGAHTSAMPIPVPVPRSTRPCNC